MWIATPLSRLAHLCASPKADKVTAMTIKNKSSNDENKNLKVKKLFFYIIYYFKEIRISRLSKDY